MAGRSLRAGSGRVYNRKTNGDSIVNKQRSTLDGLNVYHVGDASYEWSMLVFAPTRQKAKILAWENWPLIKGESSYLDIRAWKAGREFMVFAESDKPHVVESYEGDFETWQEALEHKLNQTEVE